MMEQTENGRRARLGGEERRGWRLKMEMQGGGGGGGGGGKEGLRREEKRKEERSVRAIRRDSR